MKSVRLWFIIGVALLIGGQSLFSQNREKVREEVKEFIESGRYTIDVDRALPMGGVSRSLTSPYSLELRGDTVLSHLPYFGRAYSAPYGGGKGLIFESTVTDYRMEYDKKGTARVRFTTRSDDDNYTYSVQVFDNGTATIQVTPVNKQGITFYGQLNRQRKEE